MVVFDAQYPLDRCEGEGLRHNQALRDYAFMGPGRSIRKLCSSYQQKSSVPSKRLTTLLAWSAKFSWQDRIGAWEKLQQQADEQRWEERRQQVRDDEWANGMALLELAKSILAEGPKFLRTTRRYDKQNDREIITVALDGKMAIQAFQLADKLLRLAAGMETERQAVEHSGSIVPVDALVAALRQADEDLKEDDA